MEFVSFELAKKLKEKGFEIPTNMIFAMYNELGIFHSLTTSANYLVSDSGYKCRCYYDFDDFDEYDFVAPTIAQVLKWLREEKGIHIELTASAFGYSYVISKTPELGGMDIKFSEYDGPNDGGAWDELECCAVAAIEYVLDNLI